MCLAETWFANAETGSTFLLCVTKRIIALSLRRLPQDGSREKWLSYRLVAFYGCLPAYWCRMHPASHLASEGVLREYVFNAYQR
jgi:hypothetical protein